MKLDKETALTMVRNTVGYNESSSPEAIVWVLS